MSLIVDRGVQALSKAPEKRKVLFKNILIFLFILVSILLLSIFIIWENNRVKDAVRIADMALIQATMQEIYFETASYDISNYCKEGEALLTEQCWGKFKNYISDMAFLNDPNPKNLCNLENCNEPCAYSLLKNSKDNYQILFHLDHKYKNLEAGCHYLDKNGIH